jgi:phosphomevalonate kinase
MPSSSKESRFPIGTRILAPGKLVLAGEYAVLDGAPAISLAINRGVECIIRAPRSDSLCQTPQNDSRFVSPALSQIQNPQFYEFKNWNPFSGLGKGQKPGFGGSAAACVASCYVAGLPLEQALTIHHQVQGSGSGIDVATSIYGGMIWAEGTEYRPLPPIRPLVIWTGTSARTGPRVQRYQQLENRDSFRKESIYWTKYFLIDPILSTRKLYQNLCKMAQNAGLEYQTTATEEIVALAKTYSGSAKPSGAGGGDCVVAFFPDQDAENAFKLECQKRFPIIPIEVSVSVHHVLQKMI